MAFAAPTNLTNGENTGFPNPNGTTASISPTANRLILVWISTFGTANTPTSVSGNGITYTHVLSTVDYDNGFGPTAFHLFRGMSASPSSGAISITGAASTSYINWLVQEVGDVDTTGTNGSGAVVQSERQANGSPTTSISITLAAFSDAGNGVICGIHTYDSATRTVGSGFTSSFSSSGRPSAEYRTDNDTTADWTFTPTTRAGSIALEIKPGTGGGGTTFDVVQTAPVGAAVAVAISGGFAWKVPFNVAQTAAIGAAVAVGISGEFAYSSTILSLAQTAPISAAAAVGISGEFAYMAGSTFDLTPPIEMSAAAAVGISGNFQFSDTTLSLVQTASIGAAASVEIAGQFLFSVQFDAVQTAPIGAAVAVAFSGDFGFGQGFSLAQTAPVSGALAVTFSGDFAYSDEPPPDPTFTPGVPRLAFLQRTGELFPLVLDAGGIPYAFTRSNGAQVPLRPLDSVSLGLAITEVGEMLIII